jgi:hypothetical protein
MRRLVLVCIALISSAECRAQQASNHIQGDVKAEWHDPQLISVADAARFFPGQSLTVSVSGTVDINPNEHSECNKDWLGQCHRTYWTEHHFSTPESVPAYFVLQRSDDPRKNIQFKVGAAQQIVTIPEDDSAYDKPYELRGYVAAPGTGVDPSRSKNSYRVDIAVDSSARVNQLPAFFSARKPSPTEIVDSRNVVDRYSEAQAASACAQKIRNYAVSQFPISGGQTAQQNQLALLEYAKRLAPLDVENTKALASYYTSIGAPAEAERVYNDTINTLEQRVGVAGATKDKAQLAESYISLAATIASNSGSISPHALEKADGLYERAIALLDDIKFFDREGTTLAERANELRRLKTADTLKAAIGLYKQAQAKMANTIVGDLVFRSVDGQTVLSGPEYVGYRVVDVQSGESISDFFKSDRDFVPVAWDAQSKRLLLRSLDLLAWHDPFQRPAPEPTPTTSLLADYFEAAGGTILAKWAINGVARVITRSGADFPMRVGAETKCEFTPIQLFAGPPLQQVSSYGPSTISLDGNTVAIACGNTIGISKVANDQISQANKIDLTTLGVQPSIILGVALSADGQALAVATRRPVSGPAPQVGASPVFDDRILLWTNLSAADERPREFQLANEVRTPRPGFGSAAIAVSFSPDAAALVISNGAAVQFIDVGTGASTVSATNVTQVAQPMDLPTSGLAVAIESTSTNELVIKDWPTNSLIVVSWPSHELTKLQLSPQAVGAVIFGTILTRNTRAGRSILWVSARHFVSLTNKISVTDGTASPIGQSPVTFTGGVRFGGSVLLSGGRFFVSPTGVGQQLELVQIGGERRVIGSESAAGHAFAVGLREVDSWALMTTGEDERVARIDLMRGFDKVGEISLPPIPNSYKDKLVKAMQDYVAQSRPPNIISPQRTSLIDPNDVKQALAHPERLNLIGWRPSSIPQSNFFSANSSRCCPPAVLEPMVGFRTDDNRDLYASVVGPMLAVVDFCQTVRDKVVSINDFTGTRLLAVLSGDAALVAKPAPVGQPQWFIESLPDGKILSFPNPQLVTTTNDSLPSFVASLRSIDANRFNVLGSTQKRAGPPDYWIATFSVDGSGVHNQPCAKCSLDFGKLNESIQKTSFPFSTPALFQPLLGVILSSNLGRAMFVDGELLEALDVTSQQPLLSTSASLPKLIEQNVAVVQDTRHLLKLYGLANRP